MFTVHIVGGSMTDSSLGTTKSAANITALTGAPGFGLSSIT